MAGPLATPRPTRGAVTRGATATFLQSCPRRNRLGFWRSVAVARLDPDPHAYCTSREASGEPQRHGTGRSAVGGAVLIGRGLLLDFSCLVRQIRGHLCIFCWAPVFEIEGRCLLGSENYAKSIRLWQSLCVLGPPAHPLPRPPRLQLPPPFPPHPLALPLSFSLPLPLALLPATPPGMAAGGWGWAVVTHPRRLPARRDPWKKPLHREGPSVVAAAIANVLSAA